jgi:hypothetical protein
MPVPDRRAVLGRRALLTTAVAGSVIGLTGCDIRLASDAPHIPGIKKQAPPADQAALRQLLTSVENCITSARAESSAWAARLARLHTAQHSRLMQVMATQGMSPAPTATSSGAATPGSATPDPATSTSATPDSIVALPDAERAAAQQLGSLVDVSTRNLPMAAAVGVTQEAAAQLLGRGGVPAGGTVPKPVVVQAILPFLRAATYAFEVLIAKTPEKARQQAEATLTMLRATRASWEASLGTSVPAPPDGYTLPVQPTSDATRKQLAQRVLGDLIASCADQVTATRGDRGSFLGLTTVWADATAQSWKWGAQATPFPGLG